MTCNSEVLIFLLLISGNFIQGLPGRNGFDKQDDQDVNKSAKIEKDPNDPNGPLIISGQTNTPANGKLLEGSSVPLHDVAESEPLAYYPIKKQHHHHIPHFKHFPIPLFIPVFKPLQFRKHFSFSLGHHHWPILRINKGIQFGGHHEHGHHYHPHHY